MAVETARFPLWARMRTSRWLRGVPWIPIVIIFIIIIAAAFADLIAPEPPTSINLRSAKLPPAFMEGGEWKFILGTDQLGRDIFSRVIKGTQTSITVAAATLALGGFVGTALGLIAGWRGGWVDTLVMRGVDATLAFPAVLIALVFVVTVGSGFWIVVAIIAHQLWARYARLIRGEILIWKERDFVALARIAGCSTFRILTVHLFPQVVNSLVVLTTLQVGWAIIVEATLSFLGAGIPPPTPSLGGMIIDGRDFIRDAWWISVFPGLAIMLISLSFNLFGDWIRDMLDPKLRQL